jgi:hypothetical protein
VAFPDQTRIVTHADQSTVLISRQSKGIDGMVWSLPTVEVDTAVDKVCRDHARGLKASNILNIFVFGSLIFLC